LPSQAVAASTQESKQGFIPVGHSTPQRVPSQVALPPFGAVQGTHALPQVFGSLLLTQVPLHL
jgi:hypothetical protein